MVTPHQFEVFLIALDPTLGYEIKKTCPCLVISPDELNEHVRTVIVASMTTKGRSYPTRIPVNFLNKDGYIVLDQIRTVDKRRLIKRLGIVSPAMAQQVRKVLQELFD